MKEYKNKNLFFPEPVLILGSYDKDGNPDAMNAAWGGRHDYEEIFVSLASHKSTENILLKKQFTVAFADVSHVAAADYVGLVSLSKEPAKMEKSGLKIEKAPHVDAPWFPDFPISIECEVKRFEKDEEGGGILIGKILHSFVREDALNEKGELDLDKAHLICLDEASHSYREIGRVIAKAFEAGLSLK